MEQTTTLIRPVKRVRQAQPTEEGAGVHLVRAFGNTDADMLDPFLMLDDFHSNNPADYTAGFPAHPHRGMETITYMISGSSEHADNMGHQGRIGPGDVQWMTAGSGVIHQEMPQATSGRLQGFQLWVNLPGEKKMIPPRYQEIKKEMIPVVHAIDGVEIRVIAGRLGGMEGPVKELIVPIELFDVTIQPEKGYKHPIPQGWSAFAYVFEGEAIFGPEKWRAGAEHLVIFGDGEAVQARTDEDSARFLLAAGRPLHEPIAWRGPVVMNTEEQLRDAFREMREGTFVKSRG